MLHLVTVVRSDQRARGRGRGLVRTWPAMEGEGDSHASASATDEEMEDEEAAMSAASLDQQVGCLCCTCLYSSMALPQVYSFAGPAGGAGSR